LRNTRFPAVRYRLTGAGLSPAGAVAEGADPEILPREIIGEHLALHRLARGPELVAWVRIRVRR